MVLPSNTPPTDHSISRKNPILWFLALLVVGVTANGAGLVWEQLVDASRQMRTEYLRATELVASAIQPGHVNGLTGTPADLQSPGYLRIKEQFSAVRKADKLTRFVYLMGRTPEGSFFFYVDSEPADSPDCSQPGQTYEEASEACLSAFETGRETFDFPSTDRWGTWVSGLIPMDFSKAGAGASASNSTSNGTVTSASANRIVLGMDMDARDWRTRLLRAALPAIVMTLSLDALFIMGAWLMIRRNQTGRRGALYWRHLEASVSIAAGLVLTLFVAGQVHRAEISGRDAAFAALASEKTERLAEVLRSIRFTGLESLALHYESSEEVTGAGFSKFTRFLTANPAVRGWGWIPAIAAEAKGRFEAEVQASGLPRFALWEPGAQGQRVAAADRAMHYPILRMSDGSADEDAVGLDCGAMPAQLVALTQAASTGLAVGTDPVSLPTGAADGKSILIYRPVFNEGGDHSLRGFAMADLSPSALIRSAGTSTIVLLDFALLRPEGGAVPLADNWDGEVLADGPVQMRPLFAFGKAFAITAHAGPAFMQQHPTKNGWMALGLGGLITAALGAIVHLTVRRRETLERLVEQRTEELNNKGEHLAATLRSIGDGVISSNIHGRVTHLNAAAERLTGWTSAEAHGLRVETILPLLAVQKSPAVTEGRHQGPSVQVLPATRRSSELVSRTGQHYHIADSCAPIQAINGTLLGAVWVFRDVTLENKQRELLRASEQRHRLLFELSPDAYLILHNGVFTDCNAAALEMLGARRDQLIGLAPDNVSPERQPDGTLSASAATDRMREATERGRARFEWLCRRMDGVEFHVDICLALMPLDGKSILLSVLRDITERKLSELKLVEMNHHLVRQTEVANHMAAEAATASRAKSSFLSNMSHEIRTPLNGVLGLAGMMLETPLDAHQRDLLQQLHVCGDSLLVLVNDILDFSKIEAGRMELADEVFDLYATIDDAVTLVAERSAAKGLELTTVIEDGAPACLRGDQTRLRQVLTNLLSNAVKFSESGVIAIRVRLHPQAGDAGDAVRLEFSVTDSGIGITPEAQGRLFQLFSQADSSTTRRFGGTGLGLVISKRLVECMGGGISVKSNGGDGSSFCFTVCMRTVVQKPQKPSLRGLRVLLALNAGDLVKALAEQLRHWGVTPVLVESSGVFDALCGTRKASYDVLLTDAASAVDDALRANTRNGSAVRCRIIDLSGSHDQRADIALSRPLRIGQLRENLMESFTGITVPQQPASTMQLQGHVLVAEDNAINQRVVVQLLGKLGLTCDVVCNGREALVSLSSRTYDLVLMDCQMPEMDGLTATRAIRQQEFDRGAVTRLPIVALTAGVTAQERAATQAAGMDEFLTKPIRKQEVETTLARWLSADVVKRVSLPLSASTDPCASLPEGA